MAAPANEPSTITWHWITPGHVFIALALAAFCFWQWQAAHDELTKAEAKIAQTETDRKAELETLQTKLEAIKHDQKGTKSPDDIVKRLPRYLPLPTPLVATRNGDTSQPPTITIPPADLGPLFTFATDCQACKLKLQADEAQIAHLTQERDAAVKAAKGGGFWRRVGNTAKYVGIGVGIGVTVAKL